MQLGQTLLVVKKFADCVAFYRDAMGFEIARGSAEGPLAVFRSGAQMLGLVDEAVMPEEVLPRMGDRKPNGSTVLVVVTPDVDAAHARLSAMGVEYLVEPAWFEAWSVRSSVCKDPEGNLIEIVTPPKI